MNRFLLIDGNSLAYRAYFGSAYGPQGILTNSKGIPVNAILTLSRMFEKVFNKYEPTHIFVAFDAGKKTNRHDKMPEYKAGRSKTPSELIQQMDIIKEMLDTMEIPRFELSGIEADDIVGTLSTKLSLENEVLVLSSDRDLLQLVANDNVKMIIPQNGTKPDKIVEFRNFMDEFGYLPSQVPDMKGIVGDPSDNLKGVEGIGPKGAIALINEFGTLENVYENIETITGKKKEKLLKSKDMALLCKEIATIKKDVAIPTEISKMLYNPLVSDKLINFFKKLELNSLVRFYENKQEKQQINKEYSLDNLIL